MSGPQSPDAEVIGRKPLREPPPRTEAAPGKHPPYLDKQMKSLRKILPDMSAVTADNSAKVKEMVEKLNNAIDDAIQRFKVAKPQKNARPAFDDDQMAPASSFKEDEIAFQAYRKFCNDVEGLKEEGAQVLKQVLGCK